MLDFSLASQSTATGLNPFRLAQLLVFRETQPSWARTQRRPTCRNSWKRSRNC